MYCRHASREPLRDLPKGDARSHWDRTVTKCFIGRHRHRDIDMKRFPILFAVRLESRFNKFNYQRRPPPACSSVQRRQSGATWKSKHRLTMPGPSIRCCSERARPGKRARKQGEAYAFRRVNEAKARRKSFVVARRVCKARSDAAPSLSRGNADIPAKPAKKNHIDDSLKNILQRCRFSCPAIEELP